VDRPTPLPAFGRSVVTGDDSTAIVQNPANLAFMPGGEFRFQSVYLDDRALVPYQGHALSFAAPIHALNLATGLRLDLVDPPADGVNPRYGRRSNYQWLNFGLALRTSDASALGFSYQHAYSENSDIHGMSSWSLGYSVRPANAVGIAFVGHDLNAPASESGNVLARSYDLGIALRPLGDRGLEIGLEAKFIDRVAAYWIPRATLGVDIPSLGRLRGEFSLSDPTEESQERAWLAAAQMAFSFNGLNGSMEFAAGSLVGSGLGADAESSAQHNLLTDVAFRGYREAVASELPIHALRLRIEDTPGTRDHLALLRHLWQIADDEASVAAVVLEIRATPGESLARIAELRDAISVLRKAGKRVLCHLEDADGASLYLCSAANRILVNPAGGIRFAGLRTRYFYYKGLLDKLGVKADFVRIGAHKSAPEAYMFEGASDVARADKIDLLQQMERVFVLGLAAGRGLSVEKLRERIKKGPFIASEAKEAGLVDGFAFDDELEQKVSELLGYEVELLDDADRAVRAPRTFGATPRVAVVYVDGDMVDGRSQNIPILGMKLVGSYTVAEALKDVRKDDRVNAVVLRIETGGGSAMAADVIWREVGLTARVKPVIVSMGSAAASGGYYIAAPATRILANPLTITGSIGIFYGKADVSELLTRIGVNVETYKTAPRADAESIFRPFTPEERVELERKVAQFYDMFLSRVAEGRRLPKAEIDKVGQGRVWTGEQAKDRRLVDEIGGFRQALELARKLGKLPEEAPIDEYPPIETSLVGRLLGLEGVSASALAFPIPGELRDLARALAPFVVHPDDRPLALMELAPVGP
jgi:protease-4